MKNYQEAYNLQVRKWELVKQLQTSESIEETNSILDIIEHINKRINEALSGDTETCHIID